MLKKLKSVALGISEQYTAIVFTTEDGAWSQITKQRAYTKQWHSIDST